MHMSFSLSQWVRDFDAAMRDIDRCKSDAADMVDGVPVASGIFLKMTGDYLRTYLPPAMVVGDFNETHGSTPSRETESFSISMYQEENLDVSMQLIKAGATVSNTGDATEFESIRKLWNAAYDRRFGGPSGAPPPPPPPKAGPSDALLWHDGGNGSRKSPRLA